MFDRFVDDSFKVNSPEVLYHYTSWSGAEGILRSRQFWATAHDCTNDGAELRSADEIIQQVARDLRARSHGAAAAMLDKFLEGYPTLQISQLRTVYMTCFSVARDDKEQWRKYADDGRGVCLGVRILNERPMEETDRATKIARVEYSEASWRDTVTAEFMRILPVMERAKITRRNIELGLLALHRIAAFAAMTAKQPPWAGEQEYRRVTILHNEATVDPKVRMSGGKVIRYLTADVRANGKKIALAEVIMGPNQNADQSLPRRRHYFPRNWPKNSAASSRTSLRRVNVGSSHRQQQIRKGSIQAVHTVAQRKIRERTDEGDSRQSQVPLDSG